MKYKDAIFVVFHDNMDNNLISYYFNKPKA